MESSKKSNIQIEKKGAKEERFDIRYELLKNALDKENIQYDPEIKNYEDLRDYLRANLSTREQRRLDEVLSDAQEEMINFAGRVKKDTQGKIHNFWDVIKKNFFKVKSPIALGTLITLTGRCMYDIWQMSTATQKVNQVVLDAMIGATSILGVGTTMVGAAAYLAYRRHVNSEIYDGIIRTLEVTKDNDGKIVDTRFNDEEKEEIKKYFESIGKKLDISDYNNIREEIRKLPNPKKLELINRMNDFKCNPINVKKEIAKNKFKLGKNIKDTFIAAKQGVLSGKKTVKQVASMIEKIPVLGFGFCMIEKIPGITPIVGGIISIGAGVIVGAPISVVSMVVKKIERNINRKSDIKEEKRRVENTDKRLYSKKDNELSENQHFMLEIIRRYMQEKGIKLDEDIQDKSELKKAIEGMSKKDKKELNTMLATMQKKLRKAEFKENAKKVLNDTSYSVRISSMSSVLHNVFESQEKDDDIGFAH